MLGSGKGGHKLPGPLDFPGFAQEFLRRNPAYRSDYRTILLTVPRDRAALQAELTRRWGLVSPLPPDAAADIEPALWAPGASAFTTIIDETQAWLTARVRSSADWPDVLIDRQLEDGRYVVFQDPDGPHHVWLRARDAAAPLCYVIPCDGAAEIRLAAARRLDRRLAGTAPVAAFAAHRPSPFQRRRLCQLLAILDALDAPGGRGSTYDIARTLIYPAMAIGRGAEWKSSSERRHTQRLIGEARELMASGYRRLLHGRAGGVAKSTPAK